MANDETMKVTRADFEAVGEKLEHFVSTLTPAEQAVIAGIMQLAAKVSPWWNPGIRVHYKPGGGKEVVFGGADGLLILFGYHGIKVVPPEGPLPTDFTQFLGAGLVVGKEENIGE